MNEPKEFKDWLFINVNKDTLHSSSNEFGTLPTNHGIYREFEGRELDLTYSYSNDNIDFTALRETGDFDSHKEEFGGQILKYVRRRQ